MSKKQRIKVRNEYPTNTLFVMALQSWSKEARINEHKTAFMYKRAKESLERYAGEVKVGKDTDHLLGFGKGIIEKLDGVLTRYLDCFGEPSHEILDSIKKKAIDFDLSLRSSMRPSQQKWIDRQPSAHSQSSSQEPGPSKKIMKPSTSITPPGNPDSLEMGPSCSLTTATSQADRPSFQLESGSYDIRLIVDKCEGKVWTELEKQGFSGAMIKRTLKVGDFVWVAISKTDLGKELVLDTIVERKTLSDLDSSIINKQKNLGKKIQRYADQKKRMRESGLPRRIYLVESSLSKAEEGRLTLTKEVLRQAMINGQVHEKFVLKMTQNVAETAKFLMNMTRALTEKFSSCALISSSKVKRVGSGRWELMNYQDFSEVGEKSKSLTVKEVFARQLMVFRGVTFEKASALTEKHPSLNSALGQFQHSSLEETAEELAHVPLTQNPLKIIGIKHASCIARALV